MEFSHVGDVLHPSPDDVEAAVRAAGTNTGEEVLEAARRKKMSFVRRQLAPEASRRVDAALSEEFIGAPGWRVVRVGNTLRDPHAPHVPISIGSICAFPFVSALRATNTY